MVGIPTIKDEDAKRPNRERESLIGEQSRIINRMKAALIRLSERIGDVIYCDIQNA
jgi:transposase